MSSAGFCGSRDDGQKMLQVMKSVCESHLCSGPTSGSAVSLCVSPLGSEGEGFTDHAHKHALVVNKQSKSNFGNCGFYAHLLSGTAQNRTVYQALDIINLFVGDIELVLCRSYTCCFMVLNFIHLLPYFNYSQVR